MSTKTENYNLTKPAQTDYYNVDDFNNNFDIIDEVINKIAKENANLPVSKTVVQTRTLSTNSISKGSHIIVAEKGHYSNGSALIIVEASGSLKHHSLVLAVSTSFNSNEKTITCLSNAAYATQLFSKASVETVWAANSHKVYLTLNTDVLNSVNDSVALTITVISSAWSSCAKLLSSSETADSDKINNTKSITLTRGKTSLDVDTSKFFPISGGQINGDLIARAIIANDKLYSRALEVFGKTNDNTSTNQGGYVDFHHNQAINTDQTAGATNDYTARIIEDSPGSLNIKAGPNLTAQLSVDGSEVYTNARIMMRTEDNVTAGVSPLSNGNIILIIE